jgi:octaprenyl-diphosphate synthase
MSAEVIPLNPKRPTLDPMLALTATGMNAVNSVILERMQSEIPLIPRLAGHLISGRISSSVIPPLFWWVTSCLAGRLS